MPTKGDICGYGEKSRRCQNDTYCQGMYVTILLGCRYIGETDRNSNEQQSVGGGDDGGVDEEDPFQGTLLID